MRIRQGLINFVSLFSVVFVVLLMNLSNLSSYVKKMWLKNGWMYRSIADVAASVLARLKIKLEERWMWTFCFSKYKPPLQLRALTLA